MVSLTDLWKATGSPKNQDTRFWIRNETTIQLIETVQNIPIAHKQLIETVASMLNTVPSGII